MVSRFRSAILVVLIALGLIAGLEPAPASAAEQVDISMFHDRLAPYGTWVMHPRYGWVWYPTGVEADWRPYSHGHWVLTDEYGWYWESDYDWGWAPFHYGRWAFDQDYGWIWVPGSVWAPAWVAWRSGGGFVGWAPMPPEAVWQEGVGFGIDIDVGFAPAWTFCEERFLAAPQLIVVPPARNVTIIKQTVKVTNFITINNRIVNRSIDVHRIEAAAGTHIAPVRVREVDHPVSTANSRDVRELRVFRPQPKPSAPREDVTHQQAEQPKRPPTATPRPDHMRQEEQMEHRVPRREEEKRQHEQRRRELECRKNPKACEAQ